MRGVLDTNVVVSAFIVPSGAPAQIVAHWIRHSFESLVSEPMLDEYRRVLAYHRTRKRHGLTDEQIDVVISDLRRVSTLVAPVEELDAVPADPKDNMIVECAVAGNADYIVSGDRHLLSIEEYQGIRIVSPADFLALLREET